MPSYDRFWDLQVTADLIYDFSEEIVQSCIYQQETKKVNNVPGKALMLLPVLANFEKAALACLNQIASSEVLFKTSREEFLTMVRQSGPLFKRKTIVNKVTGGVGKVYKAKFEAVGFTVHDEEPVHFAGMVLSSSDSGISMANAPVAADRAVMIIDSSGRPSLDELSNPTQGRIGYLSTAIKMADIAQAATESFTMKLVSWILGGGAAKIRVTCHGDGEGNLEMNSKAIQSISADRIGKWLHENGLTEAKNLKTISLNICMGAKHNITPAVIKSGQYSPAEGSAVHLLAASLSGFGVHGVKITGSNEVIASVEDHPDIVRTPVGPALKTGQAVRRIEIPQGFTFDRSSRILNVPTGWTVEPKQVSESKLFVIKCPSNWTTEKIASTVKRSIELANADFFFKSPTGTQCTIPSDGWIVSGKEILSAEGWTASGPGGIQFTGTGGLIAIEVQSGSKVRIIERIAKSKAKAVAVS